MQADTKLVTDGRRVMELCQARQLAANAQGGVTLDYLRFTIKRDSIPASRRIPLDTDDQNLARWFAMLFAQMLGFTLGVDRPGRDYYEFTTTIDNDNGHEVGSVSAGGESQRGSICFTIKGEACTSARPGWEQRVHAYFAELMPTITRIDLAKDFFEGELDIAELVGLYKGHEFSYRNRRPKHETHGAWLDVDGQSGHSRTFQVGKRDSGKLFRGYEKGHQYGLMESLWLRAEVEMRNVNRVIPWDAVISPAEYFAGAYPATQLIANLNVATPVPTGKAVAEASAERCIRWFKRVVAPTLVQLVKATPDLDWLVNLVLDQTHRRVPRSLRGLSPHRMQQGIERALSPFANPAVPAGAGL
jgi:DNA relaxase NicK